MKLIGQQLHINGDDVQCALFLEYVTFTILDRYI